MVDINLCLITIIYQYIFILPLEKIYLYIILVILGIIVIITGIKHLTSCYIEPDKVSHNKMEVLFPYEEQLFSDVDKIYNEYIATGYTLEHLESY